MIGAHGKAEITLMGIGVTEADLIRQACDSTGAITLSPLDKGLSGARVLLAQWPLEANLASAPHVLKLGSYTKLASEWKQTEKLIFPVDPLVGHIRFYYDEDQKLGLIRQAFLGSDNGHITSLKEWIRQQTDPSSVKSKIEYLYNSRMRHWHCSGEKTPPMEKMTFGQVFEGRTSRQEQLKVAFVDVGEISLEKSFSSQRLAPIEAIESKVKELNDTEEQFPIGLVHGDLHAQNVLVSGGQLNLIDFAWARYGWKALDFIMLECSLKLLVIPMECRIEDLIQLEILIEDASSGDVDWSRLEGRAYSRYLQTFTAALAAIRSQALLLKAVSDFEQYRRGLVVMMSCLGTYPGLNRNFLCHSLAHHVSKLT